MPDIRQEINTADVVRANVRLYSAMMGMSQTALADSLGYKRANVNAKFKGRINWRLEELNSVATALGVSAADLVTPHLGFTEIMGNIARPKGLEPPTFWTLETFPLLAPPFTARRSNHHFSLTV